MDMAQTQEAAQAQVGSAPHQVTHTASLGDRLSVASFVLPAVLIILFLSIFPLFASLYVALSRLQFVRGGVQFTFVGFSNFAKLLVGIDQSRFLGKFGTPNWLGWLLLALVVLGMFYWIAQYVRTSRVTPAGFAGRIIFATFLMSIAALTVFTLSEGGRPGTLWVTMFYVYVGISIQFLFGLGLAYLCAQHLPGRRFFRVLFLLPMMITPVGVAYMFRMMVDTAIGPLAPLWVAMGMRDVSWVSNPWTARAAIVVSDIWQWTPFMFIVLLAAIESLPHEPVEAAVVDGASKWTIFREITFPALVPVSTTLILIRMIEAFKIVDLPSVMTNGGPGSATESATLEAFIIWRALDAGGSAAIAYLLLFIVTIVATAFANLVRNRAVTE
jgi:multiple sugar transport system permease protein